MSIHFGEDDEGGVAHPEQVVGFDFEAVERGLGTAEAMESGLVARRIAYESEMLSRILEICTEGLSKIDRMDRRAGAAGIRILCIGLALRPGQVEKSTIGEVAKLLGVEHEAVRKVLVHVRKRLKVRT